VKVFVCILLSGFVSSAAFAQIGTPRAPRDLAPASLQQRGYVGGGTTIDTDFQWVQARSAGALSPYPTHFAFCLLDAAAPLPCSWTGATYTMLSSGGNGLSPPGPVPTLPGQPQSIDYQFYFNPPSNLPDALLDKSLKWTVGACASNPMTGAMQCGFAAAKDAYFVARNITAANADMGNSTATQLNVEARATTSGRTTNASGPFDVTVHAWEVVRGLAPNGAPICRVDVNHADFRDIPPNVIHYAFFANRREVRIVDLPPGGGGRDGTGVIAIYRTGGFYDLHAGSYGGLAGDVTSARGVLVANFNVNTATRAFVATAHLDQGNTLIEFDETDNVNSRCKAF
jgi:hypothetical protein